MLILRPHTLYARQWCQVCQIIWKCPGLRANHHIHVQSHHIFPINMTFENLTSKPESVAKKKVFTVSAMPKYSVLFSSVLLWQKWFGNCRFVCVRGRASWLFWGGGGDGAKEKVLRFQAPVVQWVDSTTHWLNLCLCPVDNAILWFPWYLSTG